MTNSFLELVKIHYLVCGTVCHHRSEKGACLTADDLYSMWRDGEKKVQALIHSLSVERASMKEHGRRNEAAAVVQSQRTDGADELTGCSDDEPDTGASNEAEPVKEEADSASTSAKAAPKQKKKKSKKSKGRRK
jgi:hypothetical protein